MKDYVEFSFNLDILMSTFTFLKVSNQIVYFTTFLWIIKNDIFDESKGKNVTFCCEST